MKSLRSLLSNDAGQDVAEYAVLLAVVLAIAIGLIHAIGANASTVFSQIGSKIQ
jgi:Flp pilus assembly pilin Flp